MTKTEEINPKDTYKINQEQFHTYEKYLEEMDIKTKHGLPSDRIKFLFTGSLCSMPKSEWLKAILSYLDEEYDKNNKTNK